VRHIQRSQVRAHCTIRNFFSLALYRGRRADSTRARRRRRAAYRRRALHLRATSPRAGRTLTRFLTASSIINYHRLLLRDAALQYILAQIRYGRTLRL